MQNQLANLSRGAITWLIAILIGLLLSSAYLLDGPSEVATQQLISQSEQEAQNNAKAELMQERAAMQLCIRALGPSAVASWSQDGALHCTFLRNTSSRI